MYSKTTTHNYVLLKAFQVAGVGKFVLLSLMVCTILDEFQVS